jgi:hypothetical protein
MKISLRRSCSAWSSMMESQATKSHDQSRVWQWAVVLLVGLVLSQMSSAQNTGINFPPTQGTSGAGAFAGGILAYNYTNAQIAASNSTFNMMRLAVNVDTANDPASLQKLKGYVDQFAGHYAIIAMFGVQKTGKSHGDGLPDGLAAMGAAWYNIDQVFASYPNVHYEIFNEPFGYCPTDPTTGNIDCAALTLAQKQHYVSDMEEIITDAGMSITNPKIMIDAIGYASFVDDTVQGGWNGDIAYHFYYNWIGSPYSQSRYSNKVQGDLATYGQRVWITEFGADLNGANNCYDTYDGITTGGGIDQNINTLRGLDDGLRALRANGHGVKGAFAFHGWNNGDKYDYWLAANSNGACKIREIEAND